MKQKNQKKNAKAKTKNIKCARSKYNFFYCNLKKCKFTKKNITRLWCKIVHYICVEQIKGSGGLYLYSYPFGDITQGSFNGGFHVLNDYKSFLKHFLTTSEL